MPQLITPLSPDGSADHLHLEYLVDGVRWASDAFLGGLGYRSVDFVAATADGPMTVGGIGGAAVANGQLRVDRSGDLVLVLFAENSDWHQLRNQAGHEAFHVLWNRPGLFGGVAHWWHEMLAQLTSFLLLEIRAQTDPGEAASLRRYAAKVIENSRARAAKFALDDVNRVEIPATGAVDPRHYSKLLILGLEMMELVGLEELGRVAGEVARASCAGQREPCSSVGCPADIAIGVWAASHDRAAELASLIPAVVTS